MLEIKNKESQTKKTIVYIDAANIILSCKNIDFNVDVFKLLNYLKDKFRVNRLVYFTAKFSKDLDSYKALEDYGVEIVFKEIYNENSKVKANCDVEISHRITRDLDFNLVDKVILLSGDGDFVHIMDYIKNLRKEIKVFAATPKSCSIVIKKRFFVKLSYLIDDRSLLEKDAILSVDFKNEKPPAST